MRAAAFGVMLAFDEPPDFPDPLFPMIFDTSLLVRILVTTLSEEKYSRIFRQ